MPRRLALAVLALLVLLLAAVLLARRAGRGTGGGRKAAGSGAAPTPRLPPTPLPARRVVLYFESAADERLHPEARDLSAAADETALLKELAEGVLDGPRRPEVLRPFPPDWRLRSAFRLSGGLAVLDLEPAGAAGASLAPGAPPVPHWAAGSHEELLAAQSLLVSTVKNLPSIARIVILVGGEPVETLAGHLDLSHPLVPDLRLAVEETPLEPLPTPPATATPRPGPPVPTPSPTPAKVSPKRESSRHAAKPRRKV